MGAQNAALQFSDLLQSFAFRNLGPFRAGAWISDIAVPETPVKEHLQTFYVAARTGGVWKTTNNGTSFESITDSIGAMSIGAVAVAPSNPQIVWLGSGDASNTRSAYYGNGVYRSSDGGKNWQHLGLEDTQHISRIVINRKNPEIVYVAAAGHLYTPNAQRGVFKTIDGGRNWQRVLFTGDTVGAIDLTADPRSQDVLYAAMDDFQRFPWTFRDGGPGSGIYKTTDGGTHWERLGGGLPSGTIGRIGLDLYRSNPDVLYAVLDNFNGKTGASEGRNFIGGEIYRTDDGGKTWRKRNADSDDVSRKTGYAFNQLRIDPKNDNHIFVTGSNLISSEDGGRTWIGLSARSPRSNERPFRQAFGDFRTLWIDSENPEHMLAGGDGGVFASYDGGKTCDHFSNLYLGEVYAIGVDLENPYHIFEGLQDHESWMGPSNGPSGSVGIEDWKTVGIGDGMYNEPDPNGRYTYNDQEFGHPVRIDLLLRTRTVLTPTRQPGESPIRVNWTAPLRLSPHDSKTLYFGAQTVFRSTDRGDHWQEISPDLTTNDARKISGPGAGIQHCAITTLGESPAKRGLIWAGTDDGNVQVTVNGGMQWSDRTDSLAAAGGPVDGWVTRVYPSRFHAGTAYVTKSKRRQDDYRVYVFRTDDYGSSWKNLANNLPPGAANVITEDIVNPNLLFLGTDSGIYVSFNGGAHWEHMKANMPPAPVQDLLIHPKEGDLVVATFGRGVWVANVSPLRNFTPELLEQDVKLFPICPFAERREQAWGNYKLYGNRYPVTRNEPNGMRFAFYLKRHPAEEVHFTVADQSGKAVRHLAAKAHAGMNFVFWLLDDDSNAPVPAGKYKVTLIAVGKAVSEEAQLISRAPEDSPRPHRPPRGEPSEDRP